MDLPIFQIDAFTLKNSSALSGNPAAVVPLDDWLDDRQMQEVAAENNLSETTFFVKQEDGTYVENTDNLVFKYKRKGSFKNKFGEKKENSAPRLFASNSHALTKEQIPNQIGRNSRIRMFFEPFAWQTGSGNKCGIQFKLWGVQIIELEEDTVEITPVEGGWVPTVEVETTMEGTLSPSEDELAAMLASA